MVFFRERGKLDDVQFAIATVLRRAVVLLLEPKFDAL